MIYSDIDLKFEEDENGELKKKEDLESIKQSILNIILTRRGAYSRFQDPYFGCGVLNLIGEKISSATKIMIQDEIETALENFEPRVRLIDVSVTSSRDNELHILVKYTVISLNLVDELEVDLGVIK